MDLTSIFPTKRHRTGKNGRSQIFPGLPSLNRFENNLIGLFFYHSIHKRLDACFEIPNNPARNPVRNSIRSSSTACKRNKGKRVAESPSSPFSAPLHHPLKCERPVTPATKESREGQQYSMNGKD